MIYWITGKSGTGKTTLAYKMAYKLTTEGKKVAVFDGANVRRWFPSQGFTDEQRWEHIDRIARFAAILEEQGIIVIIELFSPKREWRMKVRNYFKEFQLIYLPGGTLWPGTKYEEPDKEELMGLMR